MAEGNLTRFTWRFERRTDRGNRVPSLGMVALTRFTTPGEISLLHRVRWNCNAGRRLVLQRKSNGRHD